jgi:hypothetical protein
VIAHIRASATIALAAATAIVFAAVAAPLPAPAAPNVPPSCEAALRYEKTAASDSISAQARYESTIAGLAANQSCGDAQMHLVNEAYLLSMRAPAAHDLKIGDWRRDMARANMLLAQCTNWPGLRNTRAGIDCGTQRRYNDIIAKTFNAQPTPGPAGSPASSGRPAPPTPPAAGAAMPLPRPASPIPSPTPR